MKTKKRLQLKKLKIAQLDNTINIKGGGTQSNCDVSINDTMCPTCDHTIEGDTCTSGTIETRTGESLGNTFAQ